MHLGFYVFINEKQNQLALTGLGGWAGWLGGGWLAGLVGWAGNNLTGLADWARWLGLTGSS